MKGSREAACECQASCCPHETVQQYGQRRSCLGAGWVESTYTLCPEAVVGRLSLTRMKRADIPVQKMFYKFKVSCNGLNLSDAIDLGDEMS